MGIPGFSSEDRAEVRAQAKAAKAKAKAEAKIAAKEAKARAKVDQKIQLSTAKARAKLDEKGRSASDKRHEASARRAAKKSAKHARKLSDRDLRAEKQLDKASRKRFADEVKAAKRAEKHEAKTLSVGRKHELKMAEAELKKAEASKFGKNDAKRWLAVAQVAVPLLLPIIYRSVTQVQGGGSSMAALESRIAGPATTLDARIQRLSDSLDQLDQTRSNDSETMEFVGSNRKRLDDLRAAVDSAETMPTAQRREIHASISSELDRVNRNVIARLGVKA